jgi:hypothetical protein
MPRGDDKPARPRTRAVLFATALVLGTLAATALLAPRAAETDAMAFGPSQFILFAVAAVVALLGATLALRAPAAPLSRGWRGARGLAVGLGLLLAGYCTGSALYSVLTGSWRP